MKKYPFIKTRFPRMEDNSKFIYAFESMYSLEGLLSFILEFGACQMQDNTIVLKNNETEIEYSFGFSQNPLYNIFHQIKQYEYRLPNGYIPLFYLVCGDLLILETSSGKVRYWDHEINDNYQIRNLRKVLPLITEKFDKIWNVVKWDIQQD